RGYDGGGFVEKEPYPLADLLRLSGGDAAAAIVSDEPDPASVAIDRPPWWQYRSVPLTHYWLVPASDVRPELRVRVNGRRVYWRSEREVPGGIAFENFEVRQGFAPGQTVVFGLSRRSPLELGLAPRAKVPVIYATDLYHPHEDADDHFDLASLFALEEIDVRAVILDQAAHSQEERPGRIALEQVFALTGRRVPFAAGLRRRLSSPEDKGLEDEPRNQAGVELILKSLRESPAPVAIVAVGSLRDVAAAFNREPGLFRERAGRLLVFAGDAAEAHSNREYNVGLDPCAFACVLRSGLDVGWVPCFDGGPPENRGRASRWIAERKALLEGCSDAVLNYFLYALRKHEGDPAPFLERPVTPEDRAWLLSGTKELFSTAIFASLSGRRTCFDGKRWVAAPPERAPGLEERRVFGFAPVEAAVGDDGRVRYGRGPGSRRLLRFEVLERERYAEAMTSMTAALLEGLGRPGAPASRPTGEPGSRPRRPRDRQRRRPGPEEPGASRAAPARRGPRARRGRVHDCPEGPPGLCSWAWFESRDYAVSTHASDTEPV
ncbi:MAG: nucleoside hydrolase, partial [Planctomycetes bacterium]|nr:nucleoside hydrolase [Planctomycetota bacterium]